MCRSEVLPKKAKVTGKGFQQWLEYITYTPTGISEQSSANGHAEQCSYE